MFALLISVVFLGARLAAVPVPTFDDYPATEIFRGKPAAPVLSTSEARKFRTELRRQAAEGPNFAGHFTFARWGCGAGCVTGAIVDAKTGRVWFPSFQVEDLVTSAGHVAVHHSTDFQLASELVVATGTINEGDAGTAYFRWREGTLTLVRFDKAPGR